MLLFWPSKPRRLDAVYLPSTPRSWLSCLDVGSGRLWQASETGATQQGHIDDYLAADAERKATKGR